MKHLRQAIVIINVFYDLPPYANSEPSEESMGFSNGAKFLCAKAKDIINNIKHNSKRAKVEPLAVSC